MNLNKEHNVFNDIPGIDASKGERIAKALHRLWKKIEFLEQIRNSEQKSRSKEIQASFKDEDLTITDVKYKLLVLQLQYVRSILKKKHDESYKILHSEILKNEETSYEVDANDPKNTESQDFLRSVVSQETQTGSSLIGDWDPTITTFDSRNKKKVQIPKEKLEGPASTAAKVLFNNSKFGSKPHYHMKLDDVPFILGASSTASHSVIANVQNIIAKMKSHNKALCGPKLTTSRLPAANISTPVDDAQETSKMLNDLSQDLYELALKQAKLEKRFDAAQGKTQTVSCNEKNKNIKKQVNLNNPVDMTKRCRSNSESSIKLHADVNSSSNIKDTTKHNVPQKLYVTSSRNQTNNLPIMARRRLLRSLQNFKSHLSEEDISWD